MPKKQIFSRQVRTNKQVQASLLFSLIFLASPEFAFARKFTDSVRTVQLNAARADVVLSPNQVRRGKFLFGKACASCHVGGLTKPNPNVGLDIKSLQVARPPKNNVANLIAYIIAPTTYDGLTDISDIHPCTKQSRLYTKVRSLTRFDCFCIGGHVLLQAKLLGEKWGGGKVYY
mmetsp:Transcript_7957/g.12866  ORF Transcript_7957/g.12866 Transcript_7957/m.12866 type:complete len:174 (-) Transcript_7957:3-524(-)